MRTFWLTFVVIVLFNRLLLSGDWPQFRGPRGDGHGIATNLPVSWGGFLQQPAWQTNIPGSGWSSPIVVGDRIWLTAAELTALPADLQERKLAANPFSDVEEFQVHGTVSLIAVELDAVSGKMLRRLQLFSRENPAPIHLANSYASPTPATDGELVYCHFGSLGTAAISIETGQVVWQQTFAVDDITGPGSSPVLCGDRLILACDGADQQFLVSLDKRTGVVNWRTTRPDIDAAEGRLRRAFCTPLVIRDGGAKQIIAPAAQWVVSYDPDSGEELWRASMGPGHAVVPRPVFDKGLVYVCSGYNEPQMLALRVDGAGDVTNSAVVWKYRKQVPKISSPVVVGDEIYFVSSLGIATCLDARTGTRHWQQRLKGSYAASPLFADDKIFFTSQQGTTTVLRPGLEYRELARNQLFGQTMACLAIAGESILIRTAPTLYCVRK